MSDEPIAAAWSFAEQLWTHQRCVTWTPGVGPAAEESFSPGLYAAIQAAVAANKGVFPTLAQGKPNRVTEVAPTGVYIITDASKRKGTPAQLVPAWMIEVAYGYLRLHRRLTNRYLLATEGLNVKRSSAVCAILATLPSIQASVVKGDGIVLTWAGP